MQQTRSSCRGVLTLVIVSGCAAAQTAYGADLPGSRRATAAATRNDPLPGGSPGRRVSLGKVLAYADHHSPLIGVARARTARGDAAIESAAPLLRNNPELSTSVGPRFGSEATGVDFAISIQQRFEIAGERGLRLEAAERLRDLTRAELAEVRWLVHQRVHALFHQALVARERAAVADKFLRFSERLLSIARRRMAAGDISPLQVRIAEGELAQARQAKIAADGAYRSAQLSLAEVSGWPTAHPPKPAGSLDDPRPAPAQARLVELASAHYPGLLTKTAALREAQARLRLQEREAWPEPWVGINYARESDPAVDHGALEGADIALVTLGIPLPFWQRNQAGRARAHANLAIARAEDNALRRSLRVRLTRAASDVTVGADRVVAYGSEILPALERNLELLRRSFELGEIDLLGVLVAQRRFLEVRKDALTAYADYYRAVAELETVVGTEIWPDEGHAEGDER